MKIVVEFQYLLAPIAFTMSPTQSGPCAGAPGWSELLDAGTIHVTWARSPLAMSVSTRVSGNMTLLGQSGPNRMWRIAWYAESKKNRSIRHIRFGPDWPAKV